MLIIFLQDDSFEELTRRCEAHLLYYLLIGSWLSLFLISFVQVKSGTTDCCYVTDKKC